MNNAVKIATPLAPVLAIALACATPYAWSEPVSYSRVTQPILAEYCYACHGPDAGERQAGLRLDVRASALAKLDSGAFAIVPGKQGPSELITRVLAVDPAARMPPPGEKQLSDEQKTLLITWVAEGAPFDVHWAFLPPRRVPPPEVADVGVPGWPRNPIDSFVLARLAESGLRPSAEADRSTLIRRISLDLRGLPPTIEQVDLFLADDRANAYELVVDGLLADPAFGEKMASHWLDLCLLYTSPSPRD